MEIYFRSDWLYVRVFVPLSSFSNSNALKESLAIISSVEIDILEVVRTTKRKYCLSALMCKVVDLIKSSPI
jgi:hypothetical protein